MAQATTAISDRPKRFIERQKVFFVATAPRSDEGLVNLSPKGLAGSFAVLDPETVAYLDFPGSGVETIAHLQENGRICLMFCAFDGRPNILRIQGRGEAVFPGSEAFASLSDAFKGPAGPGSGVPEGVRSVVRVQVRRVADSCGFGVPRMDYRGDRRELSEWVQKKGPEGIAQYQQKNNRVSLDGLPGLPVG